MNAMYMPNYQKELDKIIEDLGEESRKKLLLHACCAPCSSYVLEYLSGIFEITLFFYNPNITEAEEYERRKIELIRLAGHFPVRFLEGEYDREVFLNNSRGLEQIPEGGQRCFHCYEQRIRKTAQKAREGEFDFFTTTLSISPHKNADKLNEIGERLAKEYGVRHLPADFKKKNGYKRSIELSSEYDLYRQNYCGCIYSKEAAIRSSDTDQRKQEQK